ncbi:hypothetical protein Scep_001843 [Stephania cephalantha]|uniref:Uncharacterized protein n=1 Tax=Stephania cephalantha TaxID=152367 RepID=A0AAP0LA79_9MAGN
MKKINYRGPPQWWCRGTQRTPSGHIRDGVEAPRAQKYTMKLWRSGGPVS